MSKEFHICVERPVLIRVVVVPLSAIGLEILEFNLIESTEVRARMAHGQFHHPPPHPVYLRGQRLVTSNHISLDITLRISSVIWMELIAESSETRKRGANINEINALNHLISSELFNFSSLIINQKSFSPEHKHNESEKFCVFPLRRPRRRFERIEAWENRLDMKHNEISCTNRSVSEFFLRRNITERRRLIMKILMKVFPHFFADSLLWIGNIVECLREVQQSCCSEEIYYHLSRLPSSTTASFCHDSIH